MNPIGPAPVLSRTKAYLSLLGSILCFASVPLFIKYFTFLDPWVVNGTRYSVATLIWLPVLLLLLRRTPGRASIWRAAIAPAVVNFCGQVGWALTVYYSDASVVAFAIESTFLFTVLFGLTILPQERRLGRTALFWLGALTCIAGVLVMYAASLKAGARTSGLGITIILVTSVFWGLYPVSVKKFLKDYPARLSFGVISTYTTAGLLALMLWRGDLPSLATLDGRNWMLLVLSAVIGIASSHVLYYKAIGALGPMVASGVGLIQPFLTWLGAALLLGEKLTGPLLAGGLVIVAGAFFLILAQARLKE
jgi:drug/metabolite transporter (DMT)-like permease